MTMVKKIMIKLAKQSKSEVLNYIFSRKNVKKPKPMEVVFKPTRHFKDIEAKKHVEMPKHT